MASPRETRRVPARELFLAFSRLTLHSFGGALFWSRRMLVERERWLHEQEFVEIVALAQLLPGANGANLAVIVGHRLGGVTGAAAALIGFVGTPCIVIALIAWAYHAFGASPLVQRAIAGLSAVAVGLLFATAVKMTRVLQGRALAWLFVAAAFFAVGVMRWPLLAVVAVLAPLAIAIAWKGPR